MELFAVDIEKCYLAIKSGYSFISQFASCTDLKKRCKNVDLQKLRRDNSQNLGHMC